MILERLLRRRPAGPAQDLRLVPRAPSPENPRTSLSNPDAWFVNWALGGRGTVSGRVVTPEGALACAAVMACTRVLAESVGQAPCFAYERMERGKRPAPEHPVYHLVHDQPNPEMTPATFKETLMGHLALRGNAYAEIQRDAGERPVALWPLRPDRTMPGRDDAGRRVYYTTVRGAKNLPVDVVLPADRVLHIPGLSYDGVRGYSPIDVARDTIGLALSAEEHGARVFSQGAVPGGVLEHPGSLSQDAQQRLRSSWETMHQGLAQAHRIAVLEEGMKWHAVGIDNDHAQFIESRKFSVTEIARLFRVPPHMIADLERATFSNIEHQGIEFTTHTLGTWVTRWEEALGLALFTARERARLFIEFQLAVFLRGDTPARYGAYAVGRQWGWLSINDVRGLENMNPVDGGDVYERPLNMAPLGTEPTPTPPAPAVASSAPRQVRGAFRGLFAAVAQGVLEREAAALRKAGERHLDGSAGGLEAFGAWLAGYYRDTQAGTVGRWVPTLRAACEAGAGHLGAEDVEAFARSWVTTRNRLHLAELGALLREAPAGQRPRVLEQRLAAWVGQEPQDWADRLTRTLAAAGAGQEDAA